ncbi:DUF2851 family protein [Tunicatimonas pelagia]|uniref:DUF2851 family protein n=1 Tax=Tunicatimonas pelagia TaxID=931531 RepID=UPI0026654C49|nr:DUF2851 family protein [Tunicatimonas pelagia]WKN40978.1 DUF2851 family protein [Tunicatimonas pelagia]
MKEVILYYLWQQQAFDREGLTTTDGQPIIIHSVGILNTNAGPDFSVARLHIGDLEWHGSVEIHVKASEWRHHRHHQDSAYERVVLHVVWEYDQDVYRSDGTVVPTLELRSRVDSSVLFRIQSLLENEQPFIPCAHLVNQVPAITKITQVERAAIQRMERKAVEILELHKRQQGDWQETAYHGLLGSFGFKTNKEGMQQLAQALPLRWVRKRYHDSNQLANLLLHQAGLSKYADGEEVLSLPPDLANRQLNLSVWRYSRTRPANFPHIRIKQLAVLLKKWQADVSWLLQIHPPTYYAQQFRTEATSDSAPLGNRSIDTLIVNTVVPLLTAYGLFYRNDAYQQHAWSCLREVEAEDNKITRRYAELAFPRSSALDTQGILELYQNYCTKKQCLSCSIGATVLKKQSLFVS